MLATPSIGDDSTIDPKNFATIRTTSIVQRQQKEHLQEEMHDQVSQSAYNLNIKYIS